MSVTVITYVHCDGCEEPWDNVPNPAIRGSAPGDTAAYQRRAARKAGWLVGVPGEHGRQHDYCPNCRGQS